MWNSIGATPERWIYCNCSWRGWVVPCSNQHIFSVCCLLHLTDRQLRKTALIQVQGHLSPWFCEIQIPQTEISLCCKWQGAQVTVAVQGRNISHPIGGNRHISMLWVASSVPGLAQSLLPCFIHKMWVISDTSDLAWIHAHPGCKTSETLPILFPVLTPCLVNILLVPRKFVFSCTLVCRHFPNQLHLFLSNLNLLRAEIP